MENCQVQTLTLWRAVDATRAASASRVQTQAASPANASLIYGMPGAAFTSKWYRHPERLSPSKRPPS